MGRGVEVLLLSVPSVVKQSFPRAKGIYKPTEPLGLMYIAGNLRASGIDVAILDCNGRGYGLERSVNEISAINPRILGVSCLTQEAYMVEELLRILRERLP